MLKHQRVYSAAAGTLAAITVPTKIYKDRKDGTEIGTQSKGKKNAVGTAVRYEDSCSKFKAERENLKLYR